MEKENFLLFFCFGDAFVDNLANGHFERFVTDCFVHATAENKGLVTYFSFQPPCCSFVPSSANILMCSFVCKLYRAPIQLLKGQILNCYIPTWMVLSKFTPAVVLDDGKYSIISLFFTTLLYLKVSIVFPSSRWVTHLCAGNQRGRRHPCIYICDSLMTQKSHARRLISFSKLSDMNLKSI